jgi:hypothetical protein
MTENERGADEEAMEKGIYVKEIEELCEMKAREFECLGYEDVQKEDFWGCISDSYKGNFPPLHQWVNDILTLKPNKWMSWMMVQALKEDMQPFDEN